MIAPVDINRFETALTAPKGWLDLALVVACLVIAWLVNRSLQRRSHAAKVDGNAQMHGSVARAVFPITALFLLIVAHFFYRRFMGKPLFIDVAIPLVLALAAIRILVYSMRRLFAAQTWLKSSERAIAFSFWGLVILYFTGVLPEVGTELDAIVLPIGRSSVSLLTIGQGLLAVVLTLLATLWLSGLLEQRLLGISGVDTNTKTVLAKFMRAALLIVGVLVALQSIGFDLTLLTVFGGALGVGIGLGLQKLAANYISGFTILLDRSIRLGDMITVDGRYGVVSRVTARYVVVKSLDGVEAIVPNETLVTTTVLNHSYSTPEVRVGIPLQVAYGSDLARALALMEEAAGGEPRIMGQPNPPTAFVLGFADNGVNVELGIWVRDPENGFAVLRSAINRRIYELFRENGVEIPYPRRDVKLVNTDIPSALKPAAS